MQIGVLKKPPFCLVYFKCFINTFKIQLAIEGFMSYKIVVARFTVELLREKLYDARFPFGHGYIVAAELAGIPLEAYCF